MARVVTVSVKSGPVIKVCEDWDAADQWIEQSDWDEYKLKTQSHHVYERQS